MAKATEMEKIKAGAEVMRKYPQMSRPDWGKPKKKESWVQRLKRQVKATLKGEETTVRTKGVARQAKVAGLTEAELNRLRGKK